ncbi:sensor domain-containing diguanylate cyclase [Thiomicrorhabdus sediminis]|uniref:diguanylate cyclase n=1 Tax=Thiomicrorhabdus sediminis TaxID=2580412 RepID=A0A4P9K5U3_9GAMM|nr:sensor domain-containing diguanylate cyclase [Thiomicrorhabdus sediminis]QCU90362.1 diguanylate cyclase [Thiomicrorhabdus sediminis]
MSSKMVNHTLNAILDIIREGVWDWDAKTGHVSRSPGWYRMLGYDVGSFAEDVFTWENVIHPDDYARVMEHFEAYTTGKSDLYKIEYRCKKADGDYLWIEDAAKIVDRFADGQVSRMIGAHLNIDDRIRAENDLKKKNQLLKQGNLSLEYLLEDKNAELEFSNKQLEYKIKQIETLSTTDALTKVGNRRNFEITLNNEVARAKRYHHPLSMIMLDIDFFKKINDEHGHQTGDEVLIGLAGMLKEQLRENDCIARWGGEEFVMILPETTLYQAHILSERFREMISGLHFSKGLTITCSFGVSEFEKDEETDDFFSRIDRFVYQAKERGRNCVVAA